MAKLNMQAVSDNIFKVLQSKKTVNKSLNTFVDSLYYIALLILKI